MKQTGLSTLIKKLDAVFSKYIRLRNADGNGFVTCFTCGAVHHWTKAQCGHHMKRQYMNTRFDEMNCQVQDFKCNYLEQGADVQFRENLIKKYGQVEYDKLLIRKSQTKKWSRFELEYLIKEYQEKVKQYGY